MPATHKHSGAESKPQHAHGAHGHNPESASSAKVKKPGFTHVQIGGIVGALAIAVFLVIAMFGYYHHNNAVKQQDEQMLIPGGQD